MKKKRWTFESICRAARRKAKNWRLAKKTDEWGYNTSDIRCAKGYCPLGVVFTWGKKKRPDTCDLQGLVSARVAESILTVADSPDWHPKQARRMLKLLGAKKIAP